MSRLNFQLQAQAPGTAARATTFTTLHGPVQTPVFMPVATMAAMRGLHTHQMAASGSQVLLANTYHLLLRPGPEVFRALGGIHQFMNWSGPVLTDSGGFQIFSLPKYRQMTEEGASFRSYVDGQMILLTPELSIEMQKAIGSDIMMVLDHCVSSKLGYDEAKAAMELTHRWAKRSLDARGDSAQALFGIVQGAGFKDLRRQSAEYLQSLPFDGLAIGGLAVGESREEMDELCEFTAQLLPTHLPRYLMGVGTPRDLLEAVHRGVDMFDCIIPMSYAQCGVAFTSVGKIQLRRPGYRLSERPLDPNCDCPTCRSYSQAYLHHLTKVGEVLGGQLMAEHNLYYYHRLMAEMRQHILAGDFASFYQTKRQELALTDNSHPPQEQNTRSKTPPLQRGDFEVKPSYSFKPDGQPEFYSIRQVSSGEVMHSVTDPVIEANRLYIEQSRLAERVRAVEDTMAASPLVVWDVGLGAATNAMAAVRCFMAASKAGPVRPLQLISFENNLDPLRLACSHQKLFPHLLHQAPLKLLETGRWTNPAGNLDWSLRFGDFLTLYPEAAVPDLIYYDPFSFKTDSPLWTRDTFAQLHQHCLGSNRPTQLFTYSASTAVRVALLAAGWYVARGVATGPKNDTTIASTHPLPGLDLLGPAWLGRWSRSHARYPDDLPEADQAAFDRLIQEHPQFHGR